MTVSPIDSDNTDHPPLVRPFRGLTPRPDLAASIAAPPYDVLTVEEARELARGNSWSFLHVSRAEIDLAEGTDPYADEVYAEAGANMRRLVETGALVRAPVPAFYVYRIEQGGHVQTGLAVAASVEAYLAGRIKRHEVTRPDKEDDRVRQILAVDAHTGPVLGVHRDDPRVAELLARLGSSDAPIRVTAPDGSRHSVWPVAGDDDVAGLAQAYNGLDALYIGDGHHRSAAAARVAEELRRRPGGKAPGFAPMLMVCFPESEIRILGYHRLVRDLRGSTPEAFLAALRGTFEVSPSAEPVASPEGGRFGMYLAGGWYTLSPLGEIPSDGEAVARLDVSTLTSSVLGPILGIGDLRTDPRIDFVGGSRGAEKLVRRVDSGEMAIGFTLCAMPAASLFAVADAAGIMPPKSTWFDPKLLDGLVSCPLE